MVRSSTRFYPCFNLLMAAKSLYQKPRPHKISCQGPPGAEFPRYSTTKSVKYTRMTLCAPRIWFSRAATSAFNSTLPSGVEISLNVLPASSMHSIADQLTDEDFYLPAHATIYKAFLELYRKSAPLDLIATAEQLKSMNALEEAGGAVYLGELAQAVVSGANAEYYATIVRDKSLQRSLINACSGIIVNCYDATREVGELLDESEQAVFSISQRTSGKDFTPTRELLERVFDKLSKLADAKDVITGVTTGYTRLDKLTAGLQPSDLIIVAARPSMGKTAFSMCMAINAAVRQNVPVAVFSLEMSKEQLMQRMLAVWGKVDLSKLRRPSLLTDEDWQRLYDAADVVARAPIFIDDTPALTTLELRARARRLKADKGLGMPSSAQRA